MTRDRTGTLNKRSATSLQRGGRDERRIPAYGNALGFTVNAAEPEPAY